MKRLLIDISHVLKMTLHVAGRSPSATTIEYDGKNVKIPDPDEAYEMFLISYQKTLRELNMVPIQSVVVKDGKHCKSMRREFLPGYCVRPHSAPEWMEAFIKTQDLVTATLQKYGAITVSKDGWEADDIIAALSEKTESIIWSGDKDLLAAGDVFFKGQINEDKFYGIEKKNIVVYKSLVGDISDKIPGLKNFGDKTFIKLRAEYGEDSLDELLEMLENRTLDELDEYRKDFKPFGAMVDNAADIYASYKCAKFYHPGWDLDWKMSYPSGDGTLTEWEPRQELITKDKLTPEFLDSLMEMLNSSLYNSFDIETYVTKEGKTWSEANKNKKGNKPLDVIGSILAGFSITTGSNHHITYYFPVDHADTENISLDDAEKLLNLLPEQEQGIPLIIQNTLFELPVCRLHFKLGFDRGWLPQLCHDTMIMAGYVDEDALSGLKQNSKRWLGYDQATYEEVVGDKSGMNELTGMGVLSYGCDDTICTGALYSLYKLIMDYEETWDCYSKCDVLAVFMYAEKFVNGIRFDIDKLDELYVESEKDYDKYFHDIQEFLKQLTLKEEEYIEEEKPKKRITIADLKNLKNLNEEETEDVPVKMVTKKWHGCEFSSAQGMSPKEIKRLYKIYTGGDLKCNVRKLEKIAGIIADAGESHFSDCVLNNDLEGLNNLVGESFTPNPVLSLKSSPQMCELLYDWLKLPVRIRGKLTDKMREKGQRKGNPSANEDAIKHAIVYDLQEDEETKEFLETILKARACKTAEGLYFKPYKNMPHYSDGMVHPQFRVSSQKSGRGTASMPNDAQVAKDGSIREVYCPYDDDYLWVSLDFSSQELAHTAELSQDKNMLACFTGEWDDIHSKTGSSIHNLRNPAAQMSYEEFSLKRKTDKELKDIRNKLAKPTNFRKVYDGSAPGLAINLLCSTDEAEEMLQAFSNEFPGVDEWIDRMKVVNKERGYAVTPLGRRKHLWRVLDGTWRDNHELRAAGNHPVQGGAGEQVKLVLNRLWAEKIYEELDAYFVGTVHDELNSLVHKAHVLDFIKVVHPIMCQPFAGYSIDFRSSIEIGKNFGTLVELGDTIDEEATLKLVESI